MKLYDMKVESLVIVCEHNTVNFKSNSAHTAHHARKVVKDRKLIWYLKSTLDLKFAVIVEPLIGNLSEVDTRYR